MVFGDILLVEFKYIFNMVKMIVCVQGYKDVILFMNDFEEVLLLLQLQEQLDLWVIEVQFKYQIEMEKFQLECEKLELDWQCL